MVKEEKYILPIFQNITQIVKKKFSVNDSKQRKVALYYSKALPDLLRRIMSKNHGDFEITFILSRQKKNENLLKKYVKRNIFITFNAF